MTTPPDPTPDAALGPAQLAWLSAIARQGSLSAAARELDLVPSALSYRLRRLEEALDVLLFDRRGGRARPTPACEELLRGGAELLQEWQALAQRVRRIATGWEAELTLAADAVICPRTLLDLCERFDALGAPTRLRLRSETLSGTLQALQAGRADLALGVQLELAGRGDVATATLGDVAFVFVVAPRHPLARAPQPLTPAQIRAHRIVAVADSGAGGGLSVGILPGQDVLTVPTMEMKLAAQLRGLGCGWLPQPLVQPHLDAGRLVACATTLPPRLSRVGYAWRQRAAGMGRALTWWLQQLGDERTRAALLRRRADAPDGLVD
ncbi:HTH-type transcriptional regulator YhaJ [Tepidimonas alkaliphilus]|uniref:HTH-type transcriptional regulator YhaJ n=1 Tax=Tepidimonas alkaliphilus TaxID=2588942 RepID=A0A554W4P6_9BURK|nr:LysR family transcriptional regulator [Tepidimonas alkaliphilus]TSE18533.1 HTH-type transcriptional regulator YhaJ [Tepidimonas alkaliphilus]